MKVRTYGIVGAALLAALVAGALLSPRLLGGMQAPTSVPAPKPFVGRPAGSLESDGDVIALGRVEPRSRIVRASGPGGADAGRIAKMDVAEGDLVVAGQVLAVLDTEPRLRAALAQAEANLLMKRAQLASKAADLANSERSLGASLEQYRAERDRARWDLERLSRLNKAGVYSDPALIDKQLALESATRKLEGARLALERVQERDAQGARLEEAVLRAELGAAEAAVGKAKADLDLAMIRAPISGRVLRLSGRVGQQLGSDGFAELGDTDGMIVRAEVFESDVRRVARGQSASVTSRALERPLRGTVERIGLAVGTQSVIREDPAAVLDARVVEIFITLDSVSAARVAGLTNLQVRVSINGVRPDLEKVSHAP